MNKIFTLCLLTLFLSSCSTYYVSKVNSLDTKKNPETGAFSIENDSLMITYSFFGENAPINIDVYNKLNEPLYIDWERSALIVDQYATSYMGDNIVINGSSSFESSSYRSFSDWRNSFGSSSFNATATLPRGLTFIPPHAKIEKKQLKLSRPFYKEVVHYKRVPLAQKDGSFKNVRLSKFSPDTSPLSFRSYLTLYILDKETNEPQQMTMEQNFYVEELMKTKMNPKKLLSYQQRNGDTFFMEEVKGNGLAIIGGAVAITALGYAAHEEEKAETRKGN
ncbi:hypothetical protein GCM10023231_26760 [Olivibacter ginsenosidimutans]|uniref:Lipoprotein n=1 Tax=Olivibacter ginsenosidimutans TaxID=1176537 RepID=A0ABP9BKG1_9SPHI